MTQTPKILVVDDEEALALGYARILRKEGWTVEICHTGADALARVRAALPDLVLLDVALPDISGVEVCRALKSDSATRNVIVVHVSGSRVRAEEQAESLDMGADGFLVKPVDPRALLAQLRALLRLRQSQAALVDQQLDELKEMSMGEARGPLRERDAAAFEEFCARYATLLDLALKVRIYKSATDSLRPQIVAMANAMGMVGASARDVVEVHSTAVQGRLDTAPPARVRGYIEEGRLLVVELMGYVLMHYRERCP